MPETTPISGLRGVGPQVQQRLAKLDLHTVADLLFHLPLRYQDRTTLYPIGALRAGQEALLEGVVESAEVKTGKRRMLLCMLRDPTGVVLLRFFHFNPGQQQQLRPGAHLRCFGEIRQGYDCLELVHPEYHALNPDQPSAAEANLTPVYPSTEGLHQSVLRRLTGLALAYPIADHLPEPVRARFRLPELAQALHTVHHPPPGADTQRLLAGLHPAQQRLAFEELMAQHLSLRLVRAQAQLRAAPPLTAPPRLREHLRQVLPFALTAAQEHVCAEIETDLRQPRPMQRLLQGDVGSGKTVVAALAALQAVEAGYQVAVMAPTEILAEQHYHTFTRWLEPLGLQPAWLSGSLGKKTRLAALERMASGDAAVSIGTHALFQEEVQFSRLGLVIVDEQHRFGVHQRLALRDKGRDGESQPHQLIMTATPIPRTLAMTAYADLEVSIIDELPPGRTPVATVVIPNTRRDEVIVRVANACRERKQAYWVCPLIEESEVLQCQAAEDTAARLSAELPEVRVGLVHGRMKPADKEAVMRAFKAGEIDLLVATTVIEVGVDVPNASLMIIENAERMGLAQLHQLRGRVGRGSAQSFCVLLYQTPLSQTGKSRLATLRETQDGFIIAQRDLDLRGPGEVLGTRQTGLARLRIADLQRDQHLLESVTAAAELCLRDHPHCVPPLIDRWLRRGMEYGEVY